MPVRRAVDLVKGALEIKSLPAVYQRITDVIDHPYSSAQDIAKVVGEDPGLMARLLGLAPDALSEIFAAQIGSLSTPV